MLCLHRHPPPFCFRSQPSFLLQAPLQSSHSVASASTHTSLIVALSGRVGPSRGVNQTLPFQGSLIVTRCFNSSLARSPQLQSLSFTQPSVFPTDFNLLPSVAGHLTTALPVTRNRFSCQRTAGLKNPPPASIPHPTRATQFWAPAFSLRLFPFKGERRAIYNPTKPAGYNIEFSCRPESDTAEPSHRSATAPARIKERSGGQLQRFVRRYS